MNNCEIAKLNMIREKLILLSFYYVYKVEIKMKANKKKSMEKERENEMNRKMFFWDAFTKDDESLLSVSIDGSNYSS